MEIEDIADGPSGTLTAKRSVVLGIGEGTTAKIRSGSTKIVTKKT